MDRRYCRCGQALDVRTEDAQIPGSFEILAPGTDKLLSHCPRCALDLLLALHLNLLRQSEAA